VAVVTKNSWLGVRALLRSGYRLAHLHAALMTARRSCGHGAAVLTQVQPQIRQDMTLGPGVRSVVFVIAAPWWLATQRQLRLHQPTKSPLRCAGNLVGVNEEQLNQAYVVTLSCPDRPGIVHAVAGALLVAGCNIMDSQQYGSPATGNFFMRVEVTTAAPASELRAALEPVAEAFGMQWSLNAVGQKVRTLVMASTSAHCLNDILFQQRSGTLPIEIPAIVSNHQDLAGLAEFYGIPFHYIPVTRDTKVQAEDKLRAIIAEHDIELTVLARYMQILSDELCTELTGKAINIHHSFLPSFKGAKPYHQAHARGVKLIGATAHYVTAALDEGPIIEQEVIRVDHARTPEQFVQMGRDVEGRTLVQAVQWHAEHRVLLDGNRTVVFN
jgi:formyltetrahydrofolate deformylase